MFSSVLEEFGAPGFWNIKGHFVFSYFKFSNAPSGLEGSESEFEPPRKTPFHL
jgi:hypothetical protein